MPTPYAGVATATQSPSVPPTPGVVPTVNIPDDGEAENAASIAQMVKVLADFAAWQMSPRAKASAWGEPIQIWRSAALKKMFGIDHLGFPAGRLNHWRECFNDILDYNPGGAGTHTSSPTAGGWIATVIRAGAVTGTGFVAFIDPSIDWPASRRVQIMTADDAGSVSFLQRKPCARFAPGVSIAMEWDAACDSNAAREVSMGFNEPLIPSGGGAIAQFRGSGSGVNYFAETYSAGTPTVTDTGVLMDDFGHRFRIEYHPAGQDDAGAERVLFFVDGVLKANHTTHLPSAAADPIARPFFCQLQTGSVAPILWVTPITFSANLWADAF